jgi:hypothetical protein
LVHLNQDVRVPLEQVSKAVAEAEDTQDRRHMIVELKINEEMEGIGG